MTGRSSFPPDADLDIGSSNARGSDHRRRPHARWEAQRRSLGLASRRPGGRDAQGARRAQQPRSRADRRRHHGLRDAGRRPGPQRRAQRRPGGRVPRDRARHDRRPPVRLLAAGVPLRRPGRHGRRLRHRHRVGCRGDEPGADGRLDRAGRRLSVRCGGQPLHRRRVDPRPAGPGRPGHLGRDHRQRVGPQPGRPRRVRRPVPGAGPAGDRRGPIRQRDRARSLQDQGQGVRRHQGARRHRVAATRASGRGRRWTPSPS